MRACAGMSLRLMLYRRQLRTVSGSGELPFHRRYPDPLDKRQQTRPDISVYIVRCSYV
jgi:hypothetical protein